MPRKTKPFIDKKSAESFMVVHRSQLDPKYYDEDATKFVLMSTKATGFTASGSVVGGDSMSVRDDRSVMSGMTRPRATPRRLHFAERGYGSGATVAGSVRSRASSVKINELKVVAPGSVGGGRRGIREISEVDEFGFPLGAQNDFDYGRHMAAMGGGTYISAASSMVSQGVAMTHSIATALDIPDDVLPCAPEDELERMLEAINADPAKLPADIRAAMDAIEELDEEGDEIELGEEVEFDEDGEEGVDGAGDWVIEGEEEEDGEGGSAVGAGASIAADKARKASATASGASASAAAAPARTHVVVARDFEALNDDFVLMASGERDIAKGTASDLPDGHTGGDDSEDASGSGGGGGNAGFRALPSDFDFDAHVARLMAAAEGKVTNTEDDFDEGDEFDGDENEEDEDEEDEGDEFDNDDNGYGLGAMPDAKAARAAALSAAAAARAASRMDSAVLQAMLAQYDSGEIGELEDDDPRLRSAGFAQAPPVRGPDEEYGEGEDDEEEGDRLTDDGEGGDGYDEDGGSVEHAAPAARKPAGASSSRGGARISSGASVSASISGMSTASSYAHPSGAAAPPNAYAERVISAAVEAFTRQKEEEDRDISMMGRGLIKTRNPGRGSGKTRAQKEAELQELLARQAEEKAARAEAAAAAEAEAAGGAHAPAEVGTVAAPAVPSASATAAAPAADSSAPASPAPSPARGAGFAVKIGLRKPITFSAPAPATSAATGADGVAAVTAGLAALGVSASSERAAAAADLAPSPSSATAATAAPSTVPSGPVPFGFAEGDMALDALDYFPPEWKKDAAGGGKGRDGHDAGTIVSTYTNTENRPRKLGGDDDRMTLMSGRAGPAHQARVLGGDSDAASVASAARGGNPGSAALFTGLGYGPAVIRLSKKTGLPVLGGGGKPAGIPEEGAGGDHGSDGEHSSDSDSDSDSEGEGGHPFGGGSVLPPEAMLRPRDETPEDRRARKALVKAARRSQREGKKALRLAYRSEELRQSAVMATKAENLTGRVRQL